jgi:hypothetical protein
MFGRPGLLATGGSSGSSASTADRPLGLLMLIAVVAVTSVIGVLVMLDYVGWARYRFAYDEVGWLLVDLVFAAGYAITSAYGFAIVPKLWRLQPFAWRTANQLALGWLVLALAAIWFWGVDTSLTIAGMVAALGTLAYLNLSSTRGLFGRGRLLD